MDRQPGSLVEENPEFARVFESLGIDYCCGGDRTLRAACANDDLDVDEVRSRLLEARQPDNGAGGNWESMSTLVDHVVETHHQYLGEELPLKEFVGKVGSVHADNHPELEEVHREFIELAEEMHEHTTEEESDVVPAVEKLNRCEHSPRRNEPPSRRRSTTLRPSTSNRSRT